MTATPTVDGWTRRRERITRHIERTAIELLAAQGDADITVERIADAAGVSVRTFFRYFPSRDAVFTTLPRRLNDMTCARVLARPAEENLLDAFIAAVHEGIDPGDQDLILLWGQAVQRGYRPQSDSDGGMVDAHAQVVAARLALPPDALETRALATALSSVVWSTFVTWLERGGRESLPELMARSFDALSLLRR